VSFISLSCPASSQQASQRTKLDIPVFWHRENLRRRRDFHNLARRKTAIRSHTCNAFADATGNTLLGKANLQPSQRELHYRITRKRSNAVDQ
jgi:hypothetical protein